MRTHTVITKSFRNEMHDCFGFEHYLTEEAENMSVLFFFRMNSDKQTEEIFCRKLANVMKKAILSSNSILKSSEKLTDTIEKMVFRGQTEKIESGIQEFLNQSDDINLDGYIYFVLNEYSERINAILYRVVRNSIRWLRINE